MSEGNEDTPDEELVQKARERSAELEEISIEYTEANHYRVINADGAQGTFTKNDKFFFKLYTEHPAFPTRTVRKLSDEGNLGEIVDSNQEGVQIERVMECGVMLDFNTLRELHDFLGRQIKLLEQIIQDQSDEQDAD